MKLILSALFFSIQFFIYCQNWEQVSAVPSPGRDDGVSFSINGFGYVVTGNQNGFSESNKLFQYTPISNSWKEVNPFPGVARQYAGVFVVKNLAYLIGGYSSTNEALKDVWQYNPVINEWKRLGDFQGEARWSFFTFATSDFGFLGTGATLNGPTVSDCWKYNPNNDQWTAISAYPEGEIREVHGFCLGEDCFAGKGMTLNPLQFSKKFYRYNPRKDSWSTIDDFPGESRGYIGVGEMGKYGIIGGGWGNQNVFYKDFYQLSLNGKWSALPDFPLQGWRGTSSFSINNIAYFTTGLYEDLSRTSDMFQLNIPLQEEVIIYPNPSEDFSILYSTYQGTIEVFDLKGNKVDEFDTDEKGFNRLPDLPAGEYLVYLSGELYTQTLRWITR